MTVRSRAIPAVLRPARRRPIVRIAATLIAAILPIAASAAYATPPVASPAAARVAAKRAPSPPSAIALYNEAAKRWRFFLNAEGTGPQSAAGGGGFKANVQRAEEICRQYQAATDPNQKQALATALKAAAALLPKTVDRVLVPYLNHFLVDVDKLGAKLIRRWQRGTRLGKQIDAAWKEVTHGKLLWHHGLGEANAAASALGQGDCNGAHTTFFGILDIRGSLASGQVSHGMGTLKKFASRA
jgi:hypothetical protein